MSNILPRGSQPAMDRSATCVPAYAAGGRARSGSTAPLGVPLLPIGDDGRQSLPAGVIGRISRHGDSSQFDRQVRCRRCLDLGRARAANANSARVAGARAILVATGGDVGDWRRVAGALLCGSRDRAAHGDRPRGSADRSPRRRRRLGRAARFARNPRDFAAIRAAHMRCALACRETPGRVASSWHPSMLQLACHRGRR